MKNFYKINQILTVCTLITIFFTQPCFAEQKNYRQLKKNFAKEFKIGDTTGLSGRLLFTAKISDFDRILLLDIDNQKVSKVIDDKSNNSFPSWSPDGERFAFTSDRDGNQEIYIANLKGEILSRVTNNSVTDDNASWSKDGQQILFYSAQGEDSKGEATNIFSYSLSNKKINQLTNFKNGKNSTPQLSPDGNLIAYSTNRFWPGWDICIWNIKKKTEDCILSGAKSYCRPMWSASGKLLAFSGGAFKNVDIGLYNMENASKQTISKLSKREYDVVWSPSGKELAFAAEVQDELYNIFVDRQLKTSPLLESPYSTRYLSWSPVTTIEIEAKNLKSKNIKNDLLHPLFSE